MFKVKDIVMLIHKPEMVYVVEWVKDGKMNVFPKYKNNKYFRYTNVSVTLFMYANLYYRRLKLEKIVNNIYTKQV